MHTSALFIIGLLASANASAFRKPNSCQEDNCLRALLNPTRPVASFCSAYLSNSRHPQPTFVHPCSHSSPRISSACSCALGQMDGGPKPTGVPVPTVSCSAPTTTVTASGTTTTITVPGAGRSTTVTIPTTVTLPGEGKSTTVTIPTTVTLPGEGETVTITISGAGEVTTVTVPTTVTLPGEGELTTVTIPTTVTLPGEGETITITVPGAGESTTVTVPTTVTLPGEAETVTVTVPGPGEITTVTIPGAGETVTLPGETVTLPGATVTIPGTCSSTPTPPPAEETGIPRSVPPYTYLQCTNNGGANLALSEPPTTSDSQTPAACASKCSGFTYFGVTKGITCYCGNTLNPKSNNPNENACNIPCTGNSRQLCGGQAHIQLYKK